MFASAIAIIKWVLVLISGGALYQGFANNNNGNNNNTLAARIAGAIVTTITMVAFASDASGLLGSNQPTQTEAVKTEQLFWESVEKHPSEKLYRDYLKAYPEGQFKDIALAQLVSVAPSASVAEAKQQAAPAPTPSEPIQVAQAPAVPVSAAKPAEEWQVIDERYQVKGGLVRDTKRGLMWMRCLMGQTWNGESCQGEIKSYRWRDAMKSPIDFSYEGYNDWQVPNIDDLKSLIYCSTGHRTNERGDGFGCKEGSNKPAIMTDVFPQFPEYAAVWSSSQEVKPDAQFHDMYGVNFIEGDDFKEDASIEGFQHQNHYVLLARYEKFPPALATIENYQVKDSLVTDTKTGLMWVRCSAGQEWNGTGCQGNPSIVSFEAAKKMADTLNYSGYNDWRLPTDEELRTIVYCSSGKPTKWDNQIHDECEGSYDKPTIMQDVFPQTLIGVRAWFWTSTTIPMWDNLHKTVSFENGSLDNGAANGGVHQVRFVRNIK
jgi:hypothetical protein